MLLVPAGEDEFDVIRTWLLRDFARWLARSNGVTDNAVVADAGVFLDWRFRESTGELDSYDEADISAFLLGYCPRTLPGGTDDVVAMCRALGAFIEFLADSGNLLGGHDHTAGLLRHIETLGRKIPSAAAVPAEDLSRDELAAVVSARMDEITALPSQRRTTLDELFLDDGSADHDFPFIYVPPTADELTSAVGAAELPRRIAALRDYLGDEGKPLTAKGNLKLTDGRALVELLDTGDAVNTRTAADFVNLNFLIAVAKSAHAVRVHQSRLVPVKAWPGRSPADRAVELARAVIRLGPLTWRKPRYRTELRYVNELLDDGIVHWLAPLLAFDTQAEFDQYIELACAVVIDHFVDDESLVDSYASFTEQRVSQIFATLQTAGVIEWVGARRLFTRWGEKYAVGGVVSLTAIGRQVIAELAPAAGYGVRTLDDLGDADGAVLLNALISLPDEHHPVVLGAWQPHRTPAERVAMIVAAIAEADTPTGRLVGFLALEWFEAQVVAPLVRQLLDSPAAAHAALWLIGRGLGDEETLGGFVNIGVLVDVLAATLDDPDEMCRQFTDSRTPEELEELLEEMWRYPAPETGDVLDALGRHLPDHEMAKAARKAAMRHRSWMANRG